ncbi:cell division protein ZapA [Halalkalibacterium ligniniphilum]|uniref:cell division protein ZapA n=1 Tax=Halalkalibacterium ligniniphilum TaxID=1134413 RepID=UPI0003484285|nr:cell division protein ZapA [Halalkalibacterium ligniniphilum]
MKERKEKQRTTVSIYGQQYTVAGYESPKHMREVAEELDTKMREIKQMNPYLDTTRLAVLTAVNVIDDYKKLKEKVERLEQELLAGDEKNA